MKKKILSAFSYIIIIFLLINVLVNAFIPERSVDLLGYRTFIIISPSMEPTINRDDLIIITKADEASLNERDIITFRVYLPEYGRVGYVTHYIADIQTDGSGNIIYKTQGEGKAENDYDDWTNSLGEPVDITYEDIEGVYQFKIVEVGLVIRFLQNPIYFALVVLNVFVIYGAVKYIIKSNKKIDEEFGKKEITDEDYIE